MTSTPYKLSCTLTGHSADVRSLTASPAPELFSSSRDGTARAWFPADEDGPRWSEGGVLTGQHEGFVNAVKWINGSDGEPAYIATAGQDSLIHLWPLPSSLQENSGSFAPTHTLVGHSSNVCTLDASPDGKFLVSGSWDKTAKVWSLDTHSEVETLQGHQQAVWAVLWVSPTQVLTGAADNMIRIWDGSKCVKTLKGHTQAVRALAKLGPSVGDGSLFASAGNDGSIRLWSLTTGDAVHTLNGHDSFVYSLAWIPDKQGGGLVSAGEDRTVRVWRASDGELEQTIVLPAISVWAVIALSNGDIAAGSSDGLVRIFTRSSARVAAAEDLKSFEDEVSKTALNAAQVGDVKKSDLPGPDALLQSGSKDGQVIMVKALGGSVEAHQWSASTHSWQKIGEVVDAVGSSRKQLYKGIEYDYVFDVDIAEGQPPLKLPYNVTQNPYEAAQLFLHQNDLPQAYVDQVVQFIEKNTKGIELGGGASNEYVDPYTGASSYRAGSGGMGSRPQASQQPFSGDPFTGGGRSTTSSSGPRILPHRSFLSFSQANLAALRTKLVQLNEQLSSDPTSNSLALSSSELSTLDDLIAYIVAGQAASSASNIPSPKSSETSVALKLLKWPFAQRFPGLDLMRLICSLSPLLDALPSLLESIQDTSSPLKVQETNTMLAYRALANMFGTKGGKSIMIDEILDVVNALRRRGLIGVNKNGKVALATVALNYSVLGVQKDLKTGGKALLELIADLLRDNDSEVVYRSLMALGNTLLSSQLTADIPAAGLQRYKVLAKDCANRLPEARIKALLAEIS